MSTIHFDQTTTPMPEPFGDSIEAIDGRNTNGAAGSMNGAAVRTG